MLNILLQEAQKKLKELERRVHANDAECMLMGLNVKQLEAEEEISTLKRLNENLRALVSEKEAMIIMIRDQVSLF